MRDDVQPTHLCDVLCVRVDVCGRVFGIRILAVQRVDIMDWLRDLGMDHRWRRDGGCSRMPCPASAHAVLHGQTVNMAAGAVMP